MKSITQKKSEKRARRHSKIRAKIAGTHKRPRISVFKSNAHLYAQLIDDEKGITIAAASSRDMKEKTARGRAEAVGKLLAEKALSKKVTHVVFDRGGFIDTGSIKTLADGARKAGLKF